MGCPFSFQDFEQDNDYADNQENLHPNISNIDGTFRNRHRGVRGKAFRFNGKVTGFMFSDSSQQIGYTSLIQKSEIGFL